MGFADRIALSLLYFLGAGLLALAIAVLTVLAQAIRASRAAPAWALRHDKRPERSVIGGTPCAVAYPRSRPVRTACGS